MTQLILIGMKSCGKTTIGRLLSQKLDCLFVELDVEIEMQHQFNKSEKLTSRDIYKKYGKNYFRDLETEVLLNTSKVLKKQNFVFACGGGTPLKNKNKKILKNLGVNIFLEVSREVLLERILKNGIPSFFPYQLDPDKSFDELMRKRLPIYEELAAFRIKIDKEVPEKIVNKILKEININDN